LIPGQEARVKVVPLRPISNNPRQWDQVEYEINHTIAALSKKLDGGTEEEKKLLEKLHGSVQVDPKAAVLLVIGTAEYIEFVESIIAADHANEAAKPPPMF
jgi:hypothetical protein